MAEWLRTHVEVPASLLRFSFGPDAIHRSWLAEALNLGLLAKLVTAVPDGRLYAEEQVSAGRKIVFDHGALRTVDSADNGDLPRGRHAFTRILEPLGFFDAKTYPLDRLNMTGYAYRHADLCDDIAQFFVSELHPGRFSEAFRDAVARVVSTSRDPLNSEHLAILRRLKTTRHVSLLDAVKLLPALYAAFDRQHGLFSESDYQILLEESAEMAWIATEGNFFNHLADRVPNLQATVDEQRRLERNLKDTIEVSESGNVSQTAYKSNRVKKTFTNPDGTSVEKTVAGSFVEFIQRKVDPVTHRLDLNFDSRNAQGIFKMTDARMQ